MRWVGALMEVKNLRELEVRVEVSDYLHWASGESEGLWRQEIEAERKLLRVLEPRMLARGASMCFSVFSEFLIACPFPASFRGPEAWAPFVWGDVSCS